MESLKKTIDNFFRNTCSRHEYFSVYHEFEKGETSQTFLKELENQWSEIKLDDSFDFRKPLVWEKIIERTNFNKTVQVKQKNSWGNLQRIAAVLFLPLLLSSLFYFLVIKSENESNVWAKISCPPGTRTEFQLPDGSRGVLNSGSTLEYATNFKNNRIVHLSGEAYFEVVKSGKRTFSVQTERLKVEVLGTRFSVMAYKDQSNEEVTLKSGKVKVLSINDKPLSLLSPNQQFILNKDQNHFVKKEVDAEALISWIDGKLVIVNEQFNDVAKRLSRWYGVQIEIEDQTLKEYRYYGTFENEPLSEVLRLISKTAPIHYQEVERKQYNDGSFSKRKIILKTDERRLNDFN